MNAIIAQGRKSNDSNTMSPALTQEHSQDVVNVNDPSRLQLVAKGKTAVTLSNTLSKALVFSSDPVKRHHEEFPTSPINGKHALLVKTREPATPNDTTSPPSEVVEEVPLPTKEVIEESNMTPRIVFPCISAAGLQPAAAKRIDMSSVRSIPSTTEMSVSNEVNRQPLKTVPAEIKISDIAALTDQKDSLEHRALNYIKRIRHMQGILVSRHTRQELVKFVEQTCKPVTRNMDGAFTTLTTASGSNSYSMSVTNSAEELNSMSTAALIELVQRVQTGSRKVNNQNCKMTTKSDVTMTAEQTSRLQTSSAILSSNIRKVAVDLDSDATASSSGGESDEDEPPLSGSTSRRDLKKKCCWRWTRDRAMVISRWTWLQAQVSDLEYRIRQHGEIHKQLRTSKSHLLPAPKPNGVWADDESTERAARCIALPAMSYKRHELVRVADAPMLAQKARRAVTVRCQCVQAVRQCAICSGHHHYAKSTDILTLPSRERIGQLDRSFHPVLSFMRDVNSGIELEEVVNSTDKKHTATFSKDKTLLKVKKKELAEIHKKKKLALRLKKAKEKKERELLKRKAMEERAMKHRLMNSKKRKNNKKLKNKKRPGKKIAPKSQQDWDDEEEIIEQDHAECSLVQSGASGDLNKSAAGSVNKRVSSFDIDDIVIPYHIASTTRVEKLQYKEIDTPRWRENVLNGTTIYDKPRRRSSSVTLTPLTPANPESKFPTVTPVFMDGDVMESAHGKEEGCGDSTTSSLTPRIASLPTSEQSSTSSLVTLEAEDISDQKFIMRHSVLEAKEKSRYMNFVSSSSRRRTLSTTMNSQSQNIRSDVVPNVLSPGSQYQLEPSQDTGEQINVTSVSTSVPIGHTSSIPLSASHDTILLKDELAATIRKRSSSFTANRVRRDQSLDIQDVPVVQPWLSRCFPLSGDDVTELESPRKRRNSEANLCSSWHNIATSEEQWKVITDEVEPQSLVLKLSKT